MNNCRHEYERILMLEAELDKLKSTRPSPWIKVSERMLEKIPAWIWITDGKRIDMLCCTEKTNLKICDDITHWMPIALPTPPSLKPESEEL